MSGLVVGWAFRQEGLSPTQKLVLVALADNADDEGVCWPSKDTVRNKTGLGRSSVYRALEELRARALLAVEGTRYHLAVPDWDSIPQVDAGSHTGIQEAHGGIRSNTEEPPGNRQEKPSPRVQARTRAHAVYDEYTRIFPRKRKEPGRDDLEIIRCALRVADDPEEIVACFRACAASDFHMKRGAHANRRGGRYDSLGKILKPRPTKGETWRSRIDWWLERAAEGTGEGAPQRRERNGVPEVLKDGRWLPDYNEVARRKAEAFRRGRTS